jgi:MFS transporter, SP family, sugar:H+ symporter
MSRLRGLNGDPKNRLVLDDLNEMREILEKERAVGTGSWAECFNPNTGIPKFVYCTFLGIFIHFLQQWTYVNVESPLLTLMRFADTLAVA